MKRSAAPVQVFVLSNLATIGAVSLFEVMIAGDL